MTEIGVVERDKSGLVRVVPAWTEPGGFTSRRDQLQRMIRERR